METDLNTGILSFNCYLVEPVSDVFPEEQLQRIRQMKLFYHIADNTISITEKAIPNSGMNQGRIIYRQKVPNANKDSIREHIHWSDLNNGQDIEIFSRVYRLTSCDQFTQKFLQKNGIELNESEEIPADPWTRRRLGRNEPNKSSTGHMANNVNERNKSPTSHAIYCESVPSAICLKACWIDPMDGYSGYYSKRTFKMLVYPSDSSITLIETTPGRESGIFLKRTRVPLRSNKNDQCYGWREYYPGAWVNVFSRAMFIYGCEGEETKMLLRKQHKQIEYTDYDKILEEGPPPDDSDKPPPKICFLAHMVDGSSSFSNMLFILTYHTESQKVDIYENSNQRKWVRRRVLLEDIDASNYRMDDFYIGSIIAFYKWSFKLLEPDPATLHYLTNRRSAGRNSS